MKRFAVPLVTLCVGLVAGYLLGARQAIDYSQRVTVLGPSGQGGVLVPYRVRVDGVNIDLADKPPDEPVWTLSFERNRVMIHATKDKSFIVGADE